MTLNSKAINTGESVHASTFAAKSAGVPVETRIHEKAEAPALISINAPASNPESLRILRVSLNEIFL